MKLALVRIRQVILERARIVSGSLSVSGLPNVACSMCVAMPV